MIDSENILKDHLYVGAIQCKAGHLDDARRCFEEALHIDCNCVEANFALGNVLLQLGDAVNALKYLQKTLEFDPRHSKANVLMGFCYEYLNQELKSIQYFRKAISINPNEFEGHIQLSNLFFRKEHFFQAIEHLQLVINLDPTHDFVNVYSQLGNCFSKVSQFELAIYSYKQALKYNPNSIEALLGLGKAYSYNGKIEKARDYLWRIIEIDRDNKEAKQILASLN